jgi:hypothetical protein
MDINYCLAREQVELVLGCAAGNAGARASHREMASRYRKIIDRHRTTPLKVALAEQRRRAV